MSHFLRMLPVMVPLATGFLVSCGGVGSNVPPAAGTVGTADPRAATLFTEGQAAEAAGDTKKAIKTYHEIGKNYPYAPIAEQARFRHAALLDSNNEFLDAFDSYQVFIERYPASPLYKEVLARQATVAHAAVDGLIKDRKFLGIRGKVDRSKTIEMLGKVRDNAPQAATAPKAQFAIGQIREDRKKDAAAIDAYQLLVDDYPDSGLAPEAQFRIGDIYLQQAKTGNQNPATLDQARHAFEDLLQLYPDARRAKDARERLGEIAGRDVQRSLNIADFYYKKGNLTSASFYYNEVLRKVKSGPLHDKAAQGLAKIKGS